MSIEQIARLFVANMTDAGKIKDMVTADAMVSGGVLPKPMPLMESMNIMAGLAKAFPDLKIDVQQVSVKDNQATVKVTWGGTNSGPWSISMPGGEMSTIPASGKKVSVKDTYILTVKGDKVSQMQVDSPADGGIPAALMMVGAKLQGM
jgi:predicted ester cyclase